MSFEYSYWVYILLCSDRSYYVGVTSDLEARLWGHQEGLVKGYTKNRRPVELVYSEETNDIGAALFREKQIKGWRRVKKEALIRGDTTLHDLSQGRGHWHRRWKGGRGKRLDLSW